jgi:putative PIN family toxin of toxin-antitoxin system
VIVVLDTNIWVSGLLFHGKPARAIAKAFSRGRVAICREIVEEVENVVTRKFAQNIVQVKTDFEELLPRALWVTVRGEVHVCRDPDDDLVLECARTARAQTIVTADLDLLDPKEFEGIHILTAEQFLTRH